MRKASQALSANSFKIIPSTQPNVPNRYARRKALQQYCRESGIRYQEARQLIELEKERRIKEVRNEIQDQIESSVEETNSQQGASNEAPPQNV